MHLSSSCVCVVRLSFASAVSTEPKIISRRAAASLQNKQATERQDHQQEGEASPAAALSNGGCAKRVVIAVAAMLRVFLRVFRLLLLLVSFATAVSAAHCPCKHKRTVSATLHSRDPRLFACCAVLWCRTCFLKLRREQIANESADPSGEPVGRSRPHPSQTLVATGCALLTSA